ILVIGATYFLNRQGNVIDEYQFALELTQHLQRGSDRLAQGDREESIKSFARAAEAYRKVVAREPDSFQAHSNLGICLLFVAQPQEATAALDRAVALQPEKRGWLVDEILIGGDKLFRAGRMDDARFAAEEALRLNPGNAAAMRLRMRTL